MELNDYISKGESLDPSDEEEYSLWVTFTSRFLEKEYGQQVKRDFGLKTLMTTPIVDVMNGNIGLSNRDELTLERRTNIPKGLRYLKSLQGYPVEKNTIVKKRDHDDSKPQPTTAVRIDNNMIVNISSDQALEVLAQQVQSLPSQKKSKALQAIEQLRKFTAEVVGTAAGQVLKDKF
ncbi:MAG: hypothetical protein WEA04_01030 [Candidatus Andersenbacteria bacterium]